MIRRANPASTPSAPYPFYVLTSECLSPAVASARVFSFRPSGNSIGSSKRRDQDTAQLRNAKTRGRLLALFRRGNAGEIAAIGPDLVMISAAACFERNEPADVSRGIRY